MNISVIIPVFNEEKTIKQIIAKVHSTNLANEIIVVDDGSTDKTKEILNLLNYDNLKIFTQKKNLGKGAAVRTALTHVKSEIIIIQDADLEYDPNEYGELVRPIQDGFADVVYGSRLLGGKPQRAHLFWHKLGNHFLSFVADVLYNTTLSDIMVGYKVFTKQVAESINLKSNGFSFDAEITAKILKQNKYRLYEIPVSYYGRSYAEGKKINWLQAIPMLFKLIWYRFFD